MAGLSRREVEVLRLLVHGDHVVCAAPAGRYALAKWGGTAWIGEDIVNGATIGALSTAGMVELGWWEREARPFRDMPGPVPREAFRRVRRLRVTDAGRAALDDSGAKS